MSFEYEYPRPALAVDCVVFGYDGGELQILLIRRGLPPFAGRWALPGGFVRMDETVDQGARRELREETGLDRLFLEQLYTFSDVDRDPRERVVSVAYYALVKMSDHRVQAATDAKEAAWHQVRAVPPLAFDHRKIVGVALDRLRSKVRWQPIGFELLPPKFTLTQLQGLYEAVLERPLDKRNFRKKILGMDILVGLEEKETGVRSRPAQLFKFDRKAYDEKTRAGFHFEL